MYVSYDKCKLIVSNIILKILMRFFIHFRYFYPFDNNSTKWDTIINRYHKSANGGSRRSNYNNTSRRLVPNLSPMHTLSLQKKT